MNLKIFIFFGWLVSSLAFADPVKELFSAATLGKSERVEALLAKGVDVNGTSAGGRTALMGASFNGNLQTVNTLLSYGADVNKVDNLGSTALMDAVVFGNEAIVKLLITAGADINAIDKQNLSVLAKAKSTKFTHIAKMLEKAGAKASAPAAEGTKPADGSAPEAENKNNVENPADDKAKPAEPKPTEDPAKPH